MSTVSFEGSSIPVRSDLVEAHERAWAAIAAPGTWLTGALPAAVGGEPTRYRPAGAKKKAAWLPLVEPEDATEADGPMYPSPKAGYIYRGLSLVPQSLRDYWALACAALPARTVRLPVRQIDPCHQPAADGDSRSARVRAAPVRVLNHRSCLHAP